MVTKQNYRVIEVILNKKFNSTAMKASVFALIMITIVITTLSLTALALSKEKHTGVSENPLLYDQQQKAAATGFTCPMHPEIIQDKEGKCPKCGMNLVKKVDSKEVYACPMHPEVNQDKAGKCSKCGMNLVKKDMLKSTFTCPMHPEIKDEKAGKCPKCGMALVVKDTLNL